MESSVDRDENGPIAPDPLASSVKCSVVQILNPGDLPGASADIGLDKNAPKKATPNTCTCSRHMFITSGKCNREIMIKSFYFPMLICIYIQNMQ